MRRHRVVSEDEFELIKYIEHLGVEPYNNVYFIDGSKRIVSYSLKYWHRLLGDEFLRINKKYLVKISLIDSHKGDKLLMRCGTKITFTERQLKKIKNNYAIC